MGFFAEMYLRRAQDESMFFFIINIIYEYLALSCPGVFYVCGLNCIYFQFSTTLYFDKNVDEIQNHSSSLSCNFIFTRWVILPVSVGCP